MRIAQVCPYSLSVPGGVQAQAMSLANALRQLGVDVRVLAPCDGPPPDPMVIPLGASIPTAVNGSIAPIAPDVPCVLRTINAIKNGDFDVLHLHEPLVPGPTLTAIIRDSDTPKVGTFHAAGGQTAYQNLGWFTKRFAKRLSTRIAVSVDAMLTAKTALGGDYRILYNGVDIARYTSVPKSNSGLPSVLFVGRHEHRKGLDVLVEAILDSDIDIEVKIVGNGPLTKQEQDRTRSDGRFHWLGRVSESEKIKLLRSSSVFCAPSIESESFGIVLLEAMAAEIPVVATSLPGYASVARGGKDAKLVPVGDSHELIEGIRECLKPEVASQFIENGKERAAMFSIEKLAMEHLAIYEEILR